jgi:hypothetical protein
MRAAKAEIEMPEAAPPIESRASLDPSLCQIETAHEGGTLRRPGVLYPPLRFYQVVRSGGLWGALKAIVSRQVAAIRKRVAKSKGQGEARRRVVVDDALQLRPGEPVEVKSLEEILATLDDKGTFRGLTFTPEMRQHCGKRYRVFKRLELMFDEYHKSQRRVKNTVLLEGVVCGGAGLGCDRSCFLYWREVWLRRV